MKLLVTGSRTITIIHIVERALAEFTPSLLIHGGARGVDSLADEWAKRRGIPRHKERPKYRFFGDKQAPLIRNKKMVDMLNDPSDTVLAIWDGKSGGTFQTVEYALSKGKRVKLITVSRDGKYADVENFNF